MTARPILARSAGYLQRRAVSFSAPHLGGSAPRESRRRQLLWLLPLSGGLAFYLTRTNTSPTLPTLLSSPSIIPPPPTSQSHPISSPSEPTRNILSRILHRICERILVTRRFIHLFLIFFPVLLASPMLLVGRPDEKLGGDRWGAVWWYGFLVKQMESAGPTFIKLAQWAGSRADLFPTILCDRLGALHSNGRPHSLTHTKRVISRVFHRPFSEVFDSFDEDPIGTGAIAQVYKAILRADLLPPDYLDPKRSTPPLKADLQDLKQRLPGLIDPANLGSNPPPSVPTSAVALKILHPKVSNLINRDLQIMSFFASCLTFIPGMQWLSLPEEVEVFGQMMRDQLDMRIEAENLKTFERNFAERKAPVTFPRPLDAWSNSEVIVEEYMNALPLKTFLSNGGGPFDQRIANLGLDAFLNMLLLDNFCHADLHPGNIMVKFYKPTTSFLLKNIFAALFNTSTPSDPIHTNTTVVADSESDLIVSHLSSLSHDRTAWLEALTNLSDQGYQPELVFLDSGLVTTLNAHDRKNFIELFRAIATFDGYKAGKLMVERCRSPELAVDPETFALKMQHLVLSVKSQTFSLGRIKISDILVEVLKAVRTHHVKMEADFINTVLSILLLEGIGRQLDPDMDLFKSVLPILRQVGRQMSAKEVKDEFSRDGGGGTMFKIWVYLEARELASAAAFASADEMMRYDWLMPNV